MASTISLNPAPSRSATTLRVMTPATVVCFIASLPHRSTPSPARLQTPRTGQKTRGRLTSGLSVSLRPADPPSGDPGRGDADGILVFPAWPRLNIGLHGHGKLGQRIHVVRRAVDKHAPSL